MLLSGNNNKKDPPKKTGTDPPVRNAETERHTHYRLSCQEPEGHRPSCEKPEDKRAHRTLLSGTRKQKGTDPRAGSQEPGNGREGTTSRL